MAQRAYALVLPWLCLTLVACGAGKSAAPPKVAKPPRPTASAAADVGFLVGEAGAEAGRDLEALELKYAEALSSARAGAFGPAKDTLVAVLRANLPEFLPRVKREAGFASFRENENGKAVLAEAEAIVTKARELAGVPVVFVHEAPSQMEAGATLVVQAGGWVEAAHRFVPMGPVVRAVSTKAAPVPRASAQWLPGEDRVVSAAAADPLSDRSNRLEETVAFVHQAATGDLVAEYREAVRDRESKKWAGTVDWLEVSAGSGVVRARIGKHGQQWGADGATAPVVLTGSAVRGVRGVDQGRTQDVGAQVVKGTVTLDGEAVALDGAHSARGNECPGTTRWHDRVVKVGRVWVVLSLNADRCAAGERAKGMFALSVVREVAREDDDEKAPRLRAKLVSAGVAGGAALRVRGDAAVVQAGRDVFFVGADGAVSPLPPRVAIEADPDALTDPDASFPPRN